MKRILAAACGINGCRAYRALRVLHVGQLVIYSAFNGEHYYINQPIDGGITSLPATNMPIRAADSCAVLAELISITAVAHQ
jgi:hypothetical protein